MTRQVPEQLNFFRCLEPFQGATKDKLIWPKHRKGDCKGKSSYAALKSLWTVDQQLTLEAHQESENTMQGGMLLMVHCRVSMPTQDNLMRRRMELSSIGYLCKKGALSINHLLIPCPITDRCGFFFFFQNERHHGDYAQASGDFQLAGTVSVVLFGRKLVELSSCLHMVDYLEGSKHKMQHSAENQNELSTFVSFWCKEEFVEDVGTPQNIIGAL